MNTKKLPIGVSKPGWGYDKTMKNKILKLSSLCVACATCAMGQFASTGTTTLSITVAAAAAIQIDTATTNLTTAGSTFASAYTGTTNFTYKVRTGKTSGSGTITLQVTSDFAPAGGPSLGAGDLLTYTCTTASSGTACSGSQTAATGSATSVVTFAADAHSATAGDAGSTAWSLPNNPRYQTGGYTATVTYTISAT